MSTFTVHQLTSLTNLQKTLKAHGCELWVTNLWIVTHTNCKYYLLYISLEYVNNYQVNVCVCSTVHSCFYSIPLLLTASLIRDIPVFRNLSVCSLSLMRTAAWTSSSSSVHITSAWAEPRSSRTKLCSRWRKFRDCGVPRTCLPVWVLGGILKYHPILIRIQAT